MKLNGNEIRPGYIIQHQNRLWVATKIQHTKSGKGGAFLQVELKDIRDGRKLNERFRSVETVERVRLDEKEFQFLFSNNEDVTFMDQETFEQITIDRSLIGEAAVFLEEGMMVTISSYEGDLVSVTLPSTVVCKIVQADPIVKGQTASASFKPAILENGLRVMVPPHIDSGTRIIVNTADNSYEGREKEN